MAEKKGCIGQILRIFIGLIGLSLIVSAFSECGNDSSSKSQDRKEQASTKTESTEGKNIQNHGFYYVSMMGGDEMSHDDEYSFGFNFIDDGDGYQFNPVAYSDKGFATPVDDKDFLYEVTKEGDVYHLQNTTTGNNSWALKYVEPDFVGTVSDAGQSIEVILKPHPNTNITLIDENSVFDLEGSLISEDQIKDIEWKARMNLGDEGALKAIVHTLGMDVYKIAKKDKNLKAVRVSLYYKDLIDKYGNDIPWEDAFDSTFVINNLDEVRKYKDGLGYALAYEGDLAYYVITGEYSYLWK